MTSSAGKSIAREKENPTTTVDLAEYDLKDPAPFTRAEELEAEFLQHGGYAISYGLSPATIERVLDEVAVPYSSSAAPRLLFEWCEANNRKPKLTIEISDTGARVHWLFPRRPGGSRPSTEPTEDKLKTLSSNYPKSLKHWSTSNALYPDDPQGAMRFAKKPGVAPWLLEEFQKRETDRCESNRLAHFDAAIRAGIPVHHQTGRREGQRVSLRTLERMRKSGDELRSINRKTQPKRTSKAESAPAKR